jgi:hypothetical protein
VLRRTKELMMKILVLIAAIVAVLMAFAASASATTPTSPTGTTYTSTIKAVADSSAGATKPTLDGSFTTVTCEESQVEGTDERHGFDVTAVIKLTQLTFGRCNFPVTVQAKGSIEIHPIKKGVEPHETCLTTEGDTCQGTLTWSGGKVTVATSVGTCTFTTSSTDIGVLTTTAQTGKTATFDIEGTIPRTEGNFLCGSTATWTGNYEVTTPDSLWIDE